MRIVLSMSTIKTVMRTVRAARKALPNAIEALNRTAETVDDAVAIGQAASDLARTIAEKLRSVKTTDKKPVALKRS